MTYELNKKLHNKIDSLIDEYCDNEELLLKLDSFVYTQLPNYLRNLNNTQMERVNRKNLLEGQSQKFIEQFMNKAQYYYCSSTEIFFEYKDNTYSCIREDIVLYNILTAISEKKILLPWKYKIKISIMKRIKEQNIFISTPNTETIQKIISIIYQLCNMNKESVKYFLTIIGDIMLKKKTSNIYFVSSGIKPLLKELSNNGYLLFGTASISNHFKYRYYDHKYNDSRLIPYKGNISYDIVKSSINNNVIIDLFLVACYFSNRYENSDVFIQDFCKDESMKEYVMYMKQNDEKSIVNKFLLKMTETSVDNNNIIKWKDMNYLWKIYNEMNEYPNIIFSGTLKEHMNEHFGENYIPEDDIFHNITSSYLPDVRRFIAFWEEQIYETDDQIEYEIDELFYLFQTQYKSSTMSEGKIMSLIKHYQTDVVIEDNKYVMNIGAKQWNKKKEIDDFLCNNTVFYAVDDSNNQIDIDSTYEMYKNKCTNAKKRLSKRYFEKYILEYN